MDKTNTRQSLVRLAWIGLGWVFFAIGLAGAALPVLPTTPFMILALGAFAKGSERLHNWLYNHRRFGAALHRWSNHRVIPIKAKVMSISAMTVSLTVMALQDTTPPTAMFFASALMAYGAIYILSKPSAAPGE